jgi:hypothetical protein
MTAVMRISELADHLGIDIALTHKRVRKVDQMSWTKELGPCVHVRAIDAIRRAAKRVQA